MTETSKDRGDRVGRLEARVRALQAMVLSLAAACEAAAPGTIETALHVAKTQRETTLQRGYHLSAIALGDMITSMADGFGVGMDLDG